MKQFVTSKPILSYILIAYLYTFLLWFSPMVFDLAPDIKFSIYLLGGCGPLISAYLITLIKSDRKFEIPSVKLFLLFFILTLLILCLLLYSLELGNSDRNGFIPRLKEVSVLGWMLLLLLGFITGFNISNAKNLTLKENYLKTFLFDKSNVKWYLTALIIFPMLSVIGYSLGNVFDFPLTDYFIKFDPFWLLSFAGTFLFFGGNEEFGWRGFMQKELQKIYSPLITALFIALVWNIWHLPMHYNGIYSTGGVVDLLPRFIQILPWAIIFTWFYNKSSYSILTVILLHSMLNSFSSIFGGSFEFMFILQVLLCIYLIVEAKMWRKTELIQSNSHL